MYSGHLYAMFQAVKLPARVANLDASLTDMNTDTLALKVKSIWKPVSHWKDSFVRKDIYNKTLFSVDLFRLKWAGIIMFFLYKKDKRERLW